jgi:hypothetical protein
MPGIRKADRLTDEQKAELLAEYDALPCGPTGRKRRGENIELVRKWEISRHCLNDLLEKRKKDKGDS